MPSFEPHIANATYNCKPDWVWIDTEHNPWGTESMGTLCVDGRKKVLPQLLEYLGMTLLTSKKLMMLVL